LFFVEIMSAARHDALCSELGRAFKAANATTGDLFVINMQLVLTLCEQVRSDEVEWRKNESHDVTRDDSCIASILNHSLVTEHIKSVNQLVKSIQAPSKGTKLVSLICHLPEYFANVMGTSSQTSQLDLSDCLLDHNYIPVLATGYMFLKEKIARGDSGVDWFNALAICSLLSHILSRELTRHEDQQTSGNMEKHQYKAPKYLIHTLHSKQVDEFLLLQLSVGLRRVLPPDQALPGTLANLPLEDAGMLLIRDLVSYFLHSRHYTVLGFHCHLSSIPVT
jgi:hypothetical protein